MKIYLSLNTPIECNKLCNTIAQTIHKYMQDKQTLENSVMVIEIKESLESKIEPLLEQK